MNTTQFFEQLEACIAKYDLLRHPFYKAWSAGELTRDDLREYACYYYHHVEAFPTYLAQFALRLDATRRVRHTRLRKNPCPTPSFGSTSQKAWERSATCAGTSRCRKSIV